MIDRLISLVDPSGDGYCAVALSGETATTLIAPGVGETLTIANASATRGEGTLRVSGEAGDAVLGLAAQTSQLGFETEGGTVGVQAVGASAELPGGGELEARGVAWGFEPGSLEGVATLRTVFALLADGSLFVMFGLRGEDAGDHAAERVGAARIDKDGAASGWVEPLLSTEYDGAGVHHRATLELWGEDEDAIADRGAGERRRGGSGDLGGATLEAARFDWRLNGVAGIGGYEILAAGD